MSITSALAKTAAKMVGVGLGITKSLLGGDVTFEASDKNKNKVGKLAATNSDEQSLESATEVLGLIYRLMIRARADQLYQKETENDYFKIDKDNQIKREEALIEALSLRKQVKVKKEPKFREKKPKKETKADKKTAEPTKTTTTKTPPKLETPTTTPTTATSVKTTPIIPSGIATTAGVAAVAIAGAMAVTKIIEVGKGYNVVQLSSGETVRREGSWNWRNNNPGNIEYGDYALKHGAIPYAHGMNKAQKPEERFAVFPTYEIGRKAKENLIFEGKNYKDLTIDQAIARYAPPSENDTKAYQIAVKSALDVSPEKLETLKMKDLTQEQRSLVLSAMEKQEGYGVGKKQTTVIQKAPVNKKIDFDINYDTGTKIETTSKENVDLKKSLKDKQSSVVNTTNIVSSTSEDTSTTTRETVNDRPILLTKGGR